MKSSRKRLVAELDRLFSIYIRTRDKRVTGGACMMGCGVIECCFHIISRSKHAVRWDVSNAIGTCNGANIKYEHDALFVQEVLGRHAQALGRAVWDELKARSNQVARFSMDDLRAIKADLLRRIETVCLEEKGYGRKA